MSSSCIYCPDCGQGFGHHSHQSPAPSTIIPAVQTTSHSTSWFGSLFNWTWQHFPPTSKNTNNHRSSNQPFRKKMKWSEENEDEDFQTVPQTWEEPKREQCLQRKISVQQAHAIERKIARVRDTQEQYETSCYSDETDSDRLNLRLPALPPLSKNARIQRWIDSLEVNPEELLVHSPDDDLDSCISVCLCESGTLGKMKELILNYVADSGEEIKKLNRTLEEYAVIKEQESIFLKQLNEANDNIKSEIAECASHQKAILENFLNKSSRLDLEFDVEERMNTTQTEEALENIKGKLCSDIVRKESHSMMRLLSS